MYELKNYREVMCHDNEEWCKFWTEINLLFQNWHEEHDEFSLEQSEVTKNCTFLCSFSPRYIIFELKKYKGVMFHDTEQRCKIWRKTDLQFGKWHEEFGKFSPEYLKVSKLGLWRNPIIQSRKCMSFKFTEELCAMTM